MKRLEVNPNNEKYYTKDFISGFRCGTKRQLDSDLAVIEKIREEIGTYYADCSLSISENDEQCKRCTDTVFCSVLQIIDKHKAGGDNECMFSDYPDMPYQFDNMTGSMNL